MPDERKWYPFVVAGGEVRVVADSPNGYEVHVTLCCDMSADDALVMAERLWRQRFEPVPTIALEAGPPDAKRPPAG